MTEKKRIKVLVVDDSLFFRMKFSSAIGEDPEIEVVGAASSAVEAMQYIDQFKPDVITLDVEMPYMSGIEFLKKLLPGRPLPVLVVSSRPENAFDALEAGALDFEKKPMVTSPADLAQFFETLRSKIKAIHKSKVRQPGAAAEASSASLRRAVPVLPKVIDGGLAVIAIGASTGGTDAIVQVVKDLPPATPGIVIVQHMPAGFTKMYAERLDRVCRMSAKEAEDGDRVTPGKIIVGAGEYHLRLKLDSKGYYVRSQKGEKVSGHCPSVDVLFQSAAVEAGRHCIGVILTGMGADGARGITQLHQTGAYTIGQDKESCVVYGMPMEAYKMGGISRQLPVSQIGREILQQLSKPR
ncbi:MAG: chemotaxis response regulator protein-glutamate methylesterase [Clostridiales bacterium]|nr:chemotaxis response regulator protein-glutamate methylesterase [Clostridiales bacterium]